eukprot:1154057-Pelagomonas_calceolata.AAC.2
MGIWRVARHAPGRSDSPSPFLRRCAPSTPPPEAPVKTKSLYLHIHYQQCQFEIVLRKRKYWVD